MTTNVISLIIHNCDQPSQQNLIKISKSNLSLNEIKQTGCKILKINADTNFSISDFKLYDESGKEINDINQISNNDHIFLSNGIILDLSQYEVLHIAVLGAGAVGKSALTLQYIQGQFVADYDPTIEDAYRKHVEIDGNSFLVDILDTAGQQCYNPMRNSWVRPRDGFIFVFAINNKRSFQDLESFYDQLCEVYEDDIPPFIIVGNKVDLDNNIRDNNQINIIITYWYNLNRNKKYMIPFDIMNIIIMYYTISEREVMFEEGMNLAKKWNAIRYIETSAKTGYNVENMYANIMREIIWKIWKNEHEPIVKKKRCVVV